MADAVMKQGCVLVIVLNKMDLLVEKDHAKEDYANDMQRQLVMCFTFLRNKSVVPAHSLNGDDVDAFVSIAFNYRCRWKRKITNILLNLWYYVNVLNSN